jgi:tRNA pseudouridine38-40 synthase
MSEPTAVIASGFCRLRIDLTYDGTNYAGWSPQPDQRTIEGELTSAISKLAGIKVEPVVAGRTDAGVHATAQVMHVDVPTDADDIPNWAFRLNRILDPDIRILKVSTVTDEFHARFSAVEREYQYRLADNNQILLPLERYNTATWFRALDVDRLNEASSLLLGEHDFVAFCKFREDQKTVRTLKKFHWSRLDSGILIADVAANAFCYSMVRNLVGAAVAVGEGRFEKEWAQAILENKERVSDSYVFPANGLTLVKVTY